MKSSIKTYSKTTRATNKKNELVQQSKKAARYLKAISNAQRLQLACLLVGSEQTVSELNAKIKLSQSALSQHLAVMRRANVVSTRRDSQYIYYKLTKGCSEQILEALYKQFC